MMAWVGVPMLIALQKMVTGLIERSSALQRQESLAHPVVVMASAAAVGLQQWPQALPALGFHL